MEENTFWYTTDNHYNDLRNMLQMDSMSFKGKKKGKGAYIILLTKPFLIKSEINIVCM